MKQLRLWELIQMVEWEDVRSTDLMRSLAQGDAENGHRSNIEGYRIVLEKLKRLEPFVTEWTLRLKWIEPMLGFEIDPGFYGVSAFPPADSSTYEDEGVEPGTDFATDGTPWAEMIGMWVDETSLEQIDWAEIVSVCIHDMTFYSFSKSFKGSFFQNSETSYSWKRRIFISHASEDKDHFVLPLAAELQKLGIRVWIDVSEIRWGDSIRRKIDEALAKCDFGLVVLSPNFFKKPWPEYELDGLVARAVDEERVILPIWHNVDRVEVRKYSPSLSDKRALLSAEHAGDIEGLALRIHEELYFDDYVDERN